jgi:SAM-dependent methyltransferase
MKEDTSGYMGNPVVAQLYDQVVPYRERPDVAFFVQAALESGGPVLEVGSGTGRVLIPTARVGISITGLDFSPHMLNVCREALKKEPPEVQENVTLVEGDMREFSLGKRFKLITTPFRPFQHLISIEDQLNCLKCIHQHLDPKGRFILDIFNPSLTHLTADNLGEEVDVEPSFTTPDGITVKRCNKTVSRDLLNQVNEVELIYYLTYPDGKEERLVHAFQMRYLFRYEAEHLLTLCDFEVLDVYADYQKNPLGSIYPGELIIIAKPKG